MNLQDLLKYVKENAVDVSDLVKVANIERLDRNDPYRKVLINELRERYEDKAIEADRNELFEL